MNYRTWQFILVLLFILLACSFSTGAQVLSLHRQKDSREWNLNRESQRIYFEVLSFIADSMGFRRVDINYRIHYDFFVFVRNPDLSAKSPYVARADVAVEIIDTNSVSVARQLFKKEIPADEIATEHLEKKFLQGIFSFILPQGRYTIVTEVNDLESSRRYFDNRRVIELKERKDSALVISDCIMAETVTEPKYEFTKLTPLNFGGDVPFGKNFGVFAEIATVHPVDSLRGFLKITRKESEVEKPQVIVYDTVIADKILPAKLLTIHQENGDYFYKVSDSQVSNKYLLAFRIEGDTLEQGMYEFVVYLAAGAESTSFTKRFRIKWFSMPMSLRMVERSIEPLKYIMDEEEFRKLKQASGEERKKIFKEFWKAKDPTPRTAFNEAMAEFYSRVDYAFTNFQTVYELNGINTDRGKAYILYGPPTKIDRYLLPGIPPKEFWYYSHLGRKLIFEDKSGKGDYKFVSQEQL